MSRRDTLWGALCEAFGCNKLAKARDDVNDALKSFAGLAGDRVAANVKIAHCQADLRRTDPYTDWHRWANLKDREVELHKELAKVGQQCDAARRKLERANTRLAKIEGTEDAPAEFTPDFQWQPSATPSTDAACERRSFNTQEICRAFGVPQGLFGRANDPGVGDGDLGTAAGG